MNEFMKYNFDIENIILSGYVAPGRGTPIHKNRFSNGIVFQSGGAARYTFDNRKTVTVRENDILYLPKGANYTVDSRQTGGCYVINFELFSKVTFEPFKLKVKNHKKFLEAFQSAEQVWRCKDSGFEIRSKALLYNILFELRKEYEIGYIDGEKYSLIRPAMDYIYARYDGDNIDASYLARLCGISEAYFRRIFLKNFGISPIKFINELKINRAKELIASGLYSINAAAEEAGFHDDSYFSRKFKEAAGMSPSEYKTKNS